MAPPKKGHGPVSNRVARSAQATTRKALAEKPSNVREKSVAGRGKKRAAPEEEPALEKGLRDENAIELNSTAKGARGRPRAAKAPKTIEVEDEIPESQPEPAAQPAIKRGRKPRAKVETPPAEPEIPEPEIPETQQPVETTELSLEEDEQVEELPTYSRGVTSSVQRAQPRILFSANRRTVAASDSELNDPSMRRRVGDLMRKYQDLEAKYRDLREIGVEEAERNYDRLKRQSQEKADTANELIATLKAQLAAQTALAKETQSLREQLEASRTKADQLQNQLAEANAALTGAKTEIKTLSTRLAVARSAEAASVKVPGSAMKGNSQNSRLLANAEAAVQQAQMKEDLYADLTGLIVRGVKREQDEEVYDCIQTGRNGTLHFKLAMGVDGSSDNFEETQFLYMPQLDPSRDQDLIELLPDYLAEEITFPRPHAAKFYARVMKSLTERLD
ncbi:hypothetical protein DL764_002524 [Monosporascus ibericus]|uniref:Monopolin complex subunit Csm1/Pcs1 C-terminal domain-containing protein n=1 Tax=Monosporascus ibericus TaxID=155417 RepID=A0A4V1XBT7_9PEZI|nr:hypothetical protein DL764_002524 [Monosporascus ibericus]